MEVPMVAAMEVEMEAREAGAAVERVVVER